MIARFAPFAVYANIFLVMLGLGVIAPNLNDIRRDFGVSYGAISWGVSAFAFARLVTNLPAGIAAGKLPRLPLLMVGTLCVAAGSIVAAFSTSLPLFLVARAASGVGSSISTTVGLTIVLDAADPNRRGKASGSFHSALGGGALFGPGIGAILASIGGWRLALGGAAAGALLSFLLLLVVVRAAKKARAAPVAAPPVADAPRLSPLALIFGAAFTAYIAAFAIFFVRGGVQQTVTPLMGRDEIGLSAMTLSVLLMANAGLSSLLGPYVGGLSDRFGRANVLVPGLAALAAGCVVIGLASSVPVFVAGMFITSIAGTTFSIPSSMIVDQVGAAQRSSAIGLYRVVGDAAFTVAPFASGFLMDQSGFFAAAAASSGMVVAALLAGQLQARRRMARQATEAYVPDPGVS
ncbi:MAG: MFS transporter [Dehalococcoidia bacterium]|nr:MFS transporter [Dehalococcoidia bacterium]